MVIDQRSREHARRLADRLKYANCVAFRGAFDGDDHPPIVRHGVHLNPLECEQLFPNLIRILRQNAENDAGNIDPFGDFRIDANPN